VDHKKERLRCVRWCRFVTHFETGSHGDNERAHVNNPSSLDQFAPIYRSVAFSAKPCDIAIAEGKRRMRSSGQT
jgi:hypothetical protein